MHISLPDNTILTISKEKLATLPAAGFPGNITLIDKESDVQNAIEEIRKNKIIGFDTETRPSFKKGHSYKLALIQLATPDTAYLFRTNMIGLPKPLIDLLEDEDILKIGLSIHDDFHNLKKLGDINPCAFVELQNFVKQFGIADNSLSRLYGIIFGERISKSQRLTNWEAQELTEPQQIYAALDAYACLRIYNHLMEGNFNPATSPYIEVLNSDSES